MRIGIESTHLTRSLAGIGFYLYHLIHELSRLDGDEEYTLFYNRKLVDMTLPSRMRHALNGPRSTHLWAQTRLSSICKAHKIDLLHSPGQALPLFYNCPCVLTVHDLSPMIYPGHKDVASRFVWNHLVPRMARIASHIITVSNHTRNDVIDKLGIDGSRITTIHEAASPDYFPEPDQDKIMQFRKDKGLEGGYLLAVSTLEPRKNYPFLLKAFRRWIDRSKPGATLVIIGKKGWLYDEIFETVESLDLREHVRFEGYVADFSEMRMYYNAADFFIMSPLYEGFWLPGLEALACGTPVVAPNHSSITEVIADAGILLDSWDEDEWTAAMDRLWQSPERAEWSRCGIEHAQKFSWQRAAVETLNIYRSIRK